MAADHIHESIRVNCVNPGTADTPWVGRLLDAAADPAVERAALAARQSMGRLAGPGTLTSLSERSPPCRWWSFPRLWSEAFRPP